MSNSKKAAVSVGRPRLARLKTLGVVAFLVSSLTACASFTVPHASKPKPAPVAGPLEMPEPSSTEEVPDQLKKFYEQKLVWGSCPSGIETTDLDHCASFEVPKSYEDPSLGNIKIQAYMHAENPKVGEAILVNPGGPGGSAVDFVSKNADFVFTRGMRKKFAIVGMDSRGTRWSTPIECLTDKEKDKLLEGNGQDLYTEAGRAVERFEVAELGRKCLEHSDMIKWVDTVSAARDMDVLRHLLGQDKLNFLGFSYGTHLGAQYADLFPQKVGRMVLDGAVDPTVPFDQLSYLQMKGFKASLQNFVTWCQNTGDCPLPDGEAGIEKLLDFIESLQQAPMRVGDRKLTKSLASTAIFGGMYSHHWFPRLRQALTAAIKAHDGQYLLQMADLLNDRLDDGTYEGNQEEAFIAIHSLDYPVQGDQKSWEAQAKKMKEEEPVVAQFFAWGDATRVDWPVKSKRTDLKPLTAEGAPPILVIGTTHDPATPLVMAQNLAKQLSSGVLVTVEGWDHTAYSSLGSPCVIGVVDGFFQEGKVPKPGLVCK
ncbi:hypothetical protein BSR29_05915 [Boudabousia liubingyangii]|uniref:AB hydrolase-1 domain-containing protein n=1 Tax=Boudabousia liubingyangii TaxID=1921764 RepID=A0A1Q5PLS7_9ACTO|nr:alpha/beta hydrolase [Boudabousia liubingyangii]OKL46880.1 hypothetical protein BSR28_05490 [Boudabousia liubingyangii]OKL48011.1 hypothetical protein BSR29_05915 [Boudabousia liubingyangii]